MSTRYNLNEGEYIEKLYNLLLSINLGFKNLDFKKEEIASCFEN